MTNKFNLIAFGIIAAAIILMIPAGINANAQELSNSSNGQTDVSVFQGDGFVNILVVTDPTAFDNGGGVAEPVGTGDSNDTGIVVVPTPTDEGDITTVVTDSNNTVIADSEEGNPDATNVTVVQDGDVVAIDNETADDTADNVDQIVDNSNEIIDQLPVDSGSNTDVSGSGDNSTVVDNGPVIPDNATITVDDNSTTVDAGNVTITIPDNVTSSENVTDTIIDIVDNATQIGGGLGGSDNVTTVDNTNTTTDLGGDTGVVEPDNTGNGGNVTSGNGEGPIQCIAAPCDTNIDNGTGGNVTDNGTGPVVGGGEPGPVVDNNTSTDNGSVGGVGGQSGCFVLGHDGSKTLSICIS